MSFCETQRESVFRLARITARLLVLCWSAGSYRTDTFRWLLRPLSVLSGALLLVFGLIFRVKIVQLDVSDVALDVGGGGEDEDEVQAEP